MDKIEKIIKYLSAYDGPEVQFMEVCGTHTSSIVRNGIKDIISPKIKLCSGPGCPVCVTPKTYIDRLYDYALQEGVCVCSFGDLFKVPGNKGSLTEAKAKGGDVALFYSPFEVIEKARDNPDTKYVVAAVGFETTIPLYGLLIQQIQELKLKNIQFLTSLKCMIPVLQALNEEENPIDGYIAPGHVSTIIGSQAYTELALNYQKPFAITGFSAEEVLIGIMDLMIQLKQKKNEVHNVYPSAVNEEGNKQAQKIIREYFQIGDATWRGIGTIAQSGLYLKDRYAYYDLGSRQSQGEEAVDDCACSMMIKGKSSPTQCPYFGKRCTPAHPIGPCMVSTEGVCGIWFKEGGL